MYFFYFSKTSFGYFSHQKDEAKIVIMLKDIDDEEELRNDDEEIPFLCAYLCRVPLKTAEPMKQLSNSTIEDIRLIKYM